MRVLVINVAASTDRMRFQREQLTALGLEFERIEAITPETLDPPVTDAVWRSWQRPLRATEMALFASHAAAWQRVIELGSPCLVLEDDAMLAADVPTLLGKLESADGIDHVQLETAGRKKVLARRFHPSLPLRRIVQDRHGTCAYVLYPSGARLLARRPPAPADAAISTAYALRSSQADPALAVQLGTAPLYGLVQPIEVTSLVDAVDRPDRRALPGSEARRFRRRRVLGQLRMALRMLARAPWIRRDVPVAGEWPRIDLSGAEEGDGSDPADGPVDTGTCSPVVTSKPST